MNFTKSIIIFLLIIFTFSIPVTADDIIVNGDFYYNYSGWTFDYSYSHQDEPNSIVTWHESNSTTHDGYIKHYNSYGNVDRWKKTSLSQDIDVTYVNTITVKGKSDSGVHPHYYNEIGTYKVSVGSLSSSRFPTNSNYDTYTLNVSSLSGIQTLKIELYIYTQTFKYGAQYYVDWVKSDYDPPIYIEYTNDSYYEYETSYINYDITSLKEDWTEDDNFYLNMFTPQSSYYPYYYIEEYLLTENTGQRSLEIGKRSNNPNAEIQNCNAIIIKKNSTDDYEQMGDWIEAEVISYNHTLLEYRNYDYPINQSYITGQYISVLSDIKEYIETDYLGYPDELFTLWIYAYSNSNEGNTYISHDLDSALWSTSKPYSYQFEYKPYINNNFNATIESYISVYRNGNTTKLTPTIYTNMYSSDYIPQNETGYIPPEKPEEPEEPEIPDPEPDPEPEPDPPIPPIQPNETGANQSINVSWTGEYYNIVNSTFDGLCSPIYNFTNWSLIPVYRLNSSIGEFNYYMNESFTQTAEDSSILYDSINTIYAAIHPKIRNVITYYLIWVVLLIILKKD